MREEIIRMAKQAGDVQKDWKGREGFAFDDEGIHRFAELVAAAERERIATICKRRFNSCRFDDYRDACQDIEADIRAL